MFNKGQKTIDINSLPSGSQYALSFNMSMNFADRVAKSINQHLLVHPKHKVVAMTTAKEMGTVVVFEVK